MIGRRISKAWPDAPHFSRAGHSASGHQTIFACELGFIDDTHVTFNAGFLATVRYAYPESRICFFGSRNHVEELKREMGSSLAASICWKEIYPQRLGVSYCSRLSRELLIIWRLLRSLSGNDADHLLFTSAYPATLVALKLLSSIFRPRVKLQVILHGLPGAVLGKRGRNPIRKLQDMKTALMIFPHANIQYVVLEKSIRQPLEIHIPSLRGKIQSFDHPIVPNLGASIRNDLAIPMRFGFLGVAIARKGYPVFVRLAAAMKPKHRENVEFHAIGSIEGDDMISLDAAALETQPSATRLGRPQFLNLLRKLHYVVLPHMPEDYELSAAGTLLDAIAWEKPVIARNIPIFQNMFEKYGDIGFLFDNENSLCEIVERILRKPDNSLYLRQVQNIRKARSERSPEALAESYRQICAQTVTRRQVA